MIKKLAKHGNSAALVIERPILALLGATADSDFEVKTDGQSLIITPVTASKQTSRFETALKRIGRKYAASFKELAK